MSSLDDRAAMPVAGKNLESFRATFTVESTTVDSRAPRSRPGL
jgi:hypothetical protein